MSRSCTTINSYSPAMPPPPVMSDRMAETDFEAAEVLASLSKSTPPPPSSREASISGGGGAGESVDSWGSRSKRSSTVRVKSESSPVDSALNSAYAPLVEEKKPVLLAFDLNEDEAASQTGGKSRQNLSEALYEELTRKVANLAWENENLKKVAEQFGSKLEENVGKSTSANCSIPALPVANYPYMICKDTPFVCPYNIQLPDMNPPQLGHYSVVHQSEAKLSEKVTLSPLM